MSERWTEEEKRAALVAFCEATGWIMLRDDGIRSIGAALTAADELRDRRRVACDDETERLAAERRAVYAALVAVVGSPPPAGEAMDLSILAGKVAGQVEGLRDETERLRERWNIASAALRRIGGGGCEYLSDAGAVARNALAAAHGHTDPGAQEAREAADATERLRARVRRLEEAGRAFREALATLCFVLPADAVRAHEADRSFAAALAEREGGESGQ